MYSFILNVRAWCLLEVFYNTKNQNPFEIYLTDEERKAFQERLSKDPVEVLKSFSRISTRTSTCWVINDQNRIHGLIEGSVGFDKMDQVVRDAIAEALKVSGKTDRTCISTIDGERSANNRSDFSRANNSGRDAEISHLRGEISKLGSANSQLKSDNLQLKVENSKLHSEILQLRASFA